MQAGLGLRSECLERLSGLHRRGLPGGGGAAFSGPAAPPPVRLSDSWVAPLSQQLPARVPSSPRFSEEGTKVQGREVSCPWPCKAGRDGPRIQMREDPLSQRHRARHRYH